MQADFASYEIDPELPGVGEAEGVGVPEPLGVAELRGVGLADPPDGELPLGSVVFPPPPLQPVTTATNPSDANIRG